MQRGEALDYGVLDTLLGYSLRRAQNGLYLHFSRAASDPEITPQRYAALVLIDRNPGIGQTVLGEAMGINRSGAMRLVDWFEARELAVRISQSQDARRWGVKLTPQGKKTVATMTEAVREHDAALTALLGGDGETLKRLLDQLADLTNRATSIAKVSDET